MNKIAFLNFFFLFILTSCSTSKETHLAKGFTGFVYDASLSFEGAETLNEGESEVTIVYSQNVEGKEGTCGCSINPSGGIKRREKFIKSLKNLPNLLVVDSGSSLFPWNEKLYQSHKNMNYLIHNLGWNDLAKGFLKKSKHPELFLSSNIEFKNPKQEIKKHVLLNKANLDLLFLGFTEKQSHLSKADEKQFQVINPQIGLSDQLLNNHDLVVILNDLSPKTTMELAQKTSTPTVILGHQSHKSYVQSTIVGTNTLYFSGPHFKQEFGVLKLVFAKKQGPIRFKTAVETLDINWE